MTKRADAGRSDARVFPGATAGNRERFRDSERDEALVGESPDRGVDRADRRRPTRATFDLAFDRDGVRVVAESLECGEDEDFEFAEEVAFGHVGLSTKAKIYRQGGGGRGGWGEREAGSANHDVIPRYARDDRALFSDARASRFPHPPSPIPRHGDRVIQRTRLSVFPIAYEGRLATRTITF